MTNKSLKAELKKMIAENKLKKALALLRQNVREETDIYQDILGLSRQFSEVTNEQLAQRLDFEKATKVKNRITNSLLVIIRQIEDADLRGKFRMTTKSIENPILLIAHSPEDIPALEDFMLQLNFEKVDVVFEPTNSMMLQYDLVIFDNRDLKDSFSMDHFKKMDTPSQKLINNRIALMEHYIEHTTLFIIHWGGILYWVNHNRERVQAANSKFSLYARTKEMIDFITAYRLE